MSNKYRAWDSYQKKMLSWEEIGEASEKGYLSLWNLINGLIEHIKPLKYTGLKDRNGKEIWEGDIVVQDGYIWFDEGAPNYRGTVEWCCSAWQVIAHCVNKGKRGISDGMNYELNDECDDDGSNSTWEVIGNIYENPDLLPI